MPPKVHAWTNQRLEGWLGKKGVRGARQRERRWLRYSWMKAIKAMKAKKALKAKMDATLPPEPSPEANRPPWYFVLHRAAANSSSHLLSGSESSDVSAAETATSIASATSSAQSISRNRWNLISMKSVNVLCVKYALDQKPWENEATLLALFSKALADFFVLTSSQRDWLDKQKGTMWLVSYLNLKTTNTKKPLQIKDVVHRKAAVLGVFPDGMFPVGRFCNHCDNVDHETFSFPVVTEAESVQHTYSAACHSHFLWSDKSLQVTLHYDLSSGLAVKNCTNEQILGMLEREVSPSKLSAAMKSLRDSFLNWDGTA